MGGEKSKHCRASTSLVGSPPRGRGKGPPGSGSGKQRGITPAWAGKRGCKMTPAFLSWDHPRVGGEKNCGTHAKSGCVGSPPRGRGKGGFPCLAVLHPGITPAWAGKRHFRNSGFECHRDHPRVGGEKIRIVLAHCHDVGSPPRGRGKANDF